MASKRPAERHYWILWDSLLLKDGLLYRKFPKKDGSGEYTQFVVPRSLKSDILFQMHDSVLSGQGEDSSAILLVCHEGGY